MKNTMKNQKELPEKQLTEKELHFAKHVWYQSYQHSEDDRAIEPYLDDNLIAFKPGQMGWLRRTRQALFYSVNYVGKKVGKNRKTYSDYEFSEEKGSISLNTLAAAADAMGCELVYAIRPKTRTTYSEVIWKTILKTALRSERLNVCSQKHLGLALAAFAKHLVGNSKFRQKNNWSHRRNGAVLN